MDFTALSHLLMAELGAKTRALVALDGPGGCGKSTIARHLADDLSLRVSIVQGDDFYAPMAEDVRESLAADQGFERYFDWERMRDEVLAPLSEGNPARYRRYDWGRNELADWLELAPVGIVIVDGVYSFRPELRRFYDFAIWVDTPKKECLERLAQRGENSGEWIRRWRDAEDYYVAQTDPVSAASAVVSGVA